MQLLPSDDALQRPRTASRAFCAICATFLHFELPLLNLNCSKRQPMQRVYVCALLLRTRSSFVGSWLAKLWHSGSARGRGTAARRRRFRGCICARVPIPRHATIGRHQRLRCLCHGGDWRLCGGHVCSSIGAHRRSPPLQQPGGSTRLAQRQRASARRCALQRRCRSAK